MLCVCYQTREWKNKTLKLSFFFFRYYYYYFFINLPILFLIFYNNNKKKRKKTRSKCQVRWRKNDGMTVASRYKWERKKKELKCIIFFFFLENMRPRSKQFYQCFFSFSKVLKSSYYWNNLRLCSRQGWRTILFLHTNFEFNHFLLCSVKRLERRLFYLRYRFTFSYSVKEVSNLTVDD